jgi:O-6-methylguanine DNA methyltransferase
VLSSTSPSARTSINNFAAVTASKAGEEGTLKKIKKCLDSDALPDAAGDCDHRRYRERSARNYVPYRHKEHSWRSTGRRLHLAYEKTFSDKVRDIVRKIPKGKTMTYKEVASKAGNPKAARAVGAVMRSNYDPSIPCHRVVASDGKMRPCNRGARIR